LARLPQATVPVPTRDGAPPLGLSVVGPRGTDEALLRLACELEKALME
jgi:Asp-tRNA(Asn)/Glu-tRNA(Gln) amidotransferase A subunit family amidase